MQVLRKAMLLAVVPALILATHAAVMAVPIRTLPDLQSVTIYEMTFSTIANTYAPNAMQLTTRLPDPLSDINRDFSFATTENYDVFYSNADGTFNIDGAFLTIEGVWTAQPQFGGMNINEVDLTFGGTSPHSQFGDFVASFIYGSNCSSCIIGSEATAVDHNLGTFPRFGATSATDPNERFRLTIGFNGISDVTSAVPEPSTWVLLASGLAGLLGLRRKLG